MIYKFCTCILEYLDSWEEPFGGTPVLIGQIFIIYWNCSGMRVSTYNFSGSVFVKVFKG